MKKSAITPNAKAAGVFHLGGKVPIYRFGFGAMRLTGPGIWGKPKDPKEAKAVLKRALELGINFIDTADSYGPEVSENLIAEALYPYSKDLTIATKGGFTRPGPNQWVENGRPEYIRKCVEGSLKRLKLERIELYQLHRIDPAVPVEETLGVLKEMQKAGKIRFIGLSEVSVEDIKRVIQTVEIVSVQNRYNVADRKSEPVLEYCEKNGLAFIPWFPIGSGNLVSEGGILDKMAKQKGATPAQIALAWLLKRSPVMVPIAGTSSVAHLEENVGAVSIDLSDKDLELLDTLQEK